MRAKTTHVRVEKDLVDYWNRVFPGVNKSEIIKIAWNTSALNLESKLKEKNFKNKFGRSIYGDMWKDE